jgi:uncharacterized membrane protein
MANVNKIHKENLGLNEIIALWITKYVGTMWCAYAFSVLALYGLPAAIQGGAAGFVAWASSQFIQLVLLPIIIVGQNLQSKHSEIQANEDYKTNVEAEKRIEELQEVLGRIEVDKLDKIIKLLTKKK